MGVFGSGLGGLFEVKANGTEITMDFSLYQELSVLDSIRTCSARFMVGNQFVCRSGGCVCASSLTQVLLLCPGVGRRPCARHFGVDEHHQCLITSA